jgi:hypothetical protein
MQWKNKQITGCSITSTAGGVCSIKMQGNIIVTQAGKKIKLQHLPNGIIAFETTKGNQYNISLESKL